MALREHLKGDEAWIYLAEWKSGVAYLIEGLGNLSQWVQAQTELEGAAWIEIEGAALRGDQLGLTQWYGGSVALAAAEHAGLQREAIKGWDIEGPHGDDGLWRLMWTYNSSSFVQVLVTRDWGGMEVYQEIHATLVRRLSRLPQLLELVKVNEQLQSTRLKLEEGLRRIHGRVRFPGICKLY